MTREIYRVRKNWSDAKTQILKTTSLEEAIKVRDAAGESYFVYGPKGKLLYPPKKTKKNSIQLPLKQEEFDLDCNENNLPLSQPTIAGPKDGLYRVRKNWNDSSSQVASFKNQKDAINFCNTYNIKEYNVYDDNGECVYPVFPDSDPGTSFKVGDLVTTDKLFYTNNKKIQDQYKNKKFQVISIFKKHFLEVAPENSKNPVGIFIDTAVSLYNKD